MPQKSTHRFIVAPQDRHYPSHVVELVQEVIIHLAKYMVTAGAVLAGGTTHLLQCEGIIVTLGLTRGQLDKRGSITS